MSKLISQESNLNNSSESLKLKRLVLRSNNSQKMLVVRRHRYACSASAGNEHWRGFLTDNPHGHSVII